MPDLWPDLTNLAAPRGMFEMLYDAAGSISEKTNGAIDFHIDTLGVGAAGVIKHIRHNCYLRVVKKDYMLLLFRVTTPVAAPFPATIETPEGERYPDIQDESALRDAIAQVLQRDRTKEIVLYLLSTTPRAQAK